MKSSVNQLTDSSENSEDCIWNLGRCTGRVFARGSISLISQDLRLRLNFEYVVSVSDWP